ncbi:MAG TPA: FtsX-like permease family protein [Chryseolinea sp.]|nr:FtsX-like permease family protein [Chryseolinea sp.]
MFKNYLITALRNLKKNRLYTFVNVLGLALGVGCCVVIFVIVRYETSFDNYHTKAERIYRVNLTQHGVQGRQLNGCNFSPVTEAIRHDVTGLEAVTGVYCLQRYQITKDKDLFEDRFAFFADEHYSDVFDVKWIAGNPRQALKLPGMVVVTESFANKFLGGVRNAPGSTFVLENKLPLTVSGVVETPPTNTDHPYSMLISYATLDDFIPGLEDDWNNVRGGATYVLFGPSTTTDQVYGQFNKIISKHLPEDRAKNTSFFLMPLSDNHDRNGDYNSYNYDFPIPVMIILSIMAAMIAFIACINFVNLATAQSLKRAREVGLRKTMGSSRLQLIVQYMSEAFIITLLAVSVGVVLAKAGIMQLNSEFSGDPLRFNFLKEPSILLFMLAITVVISVLAGFYPALILSGYQPLLALRSQTYTGKSGGFSLRRILVVAQFMGAQTLILVTLIVTSHIDHFKNRPLDYDPETILMIPYLRGNDAGEHERLRKSLREVPGVVNLTFGLAGNEHGEFYTREDAKHVAVLSYVDTSYFATFQMRLLAGRNFDDRQTAAPEVIVNEALLEKLEISNPRSAIGSMFVLGDQNVVIRAVVKNTYTQPLTNKVDPVVIQYRPEKFASVALNISTADVSSTLAGIENAWKSVYPDYLYKYEFMDEKAAREFGFFTVIFSFFGIASFLAIFIGCLGLYGLISFMAIQRTKEIGIRKVLGATVSNIILMFTRESAVLILIAFIVASPAGHYLGIAMMMELPERINPGWWIFALTFFGSLIVALTTVAHRSFGAATQNPVISLRHE